MCISMCVSCKYVYHACLFMALTWNLLGISNHVCVHSSITDTALVVQHD